MRVTLELDIPDRLADELQSAAKGAGIAAHAWAALAVEAELASRRLSRVVSGAHGPRIGAREIEDVDLISYPVRLDRSLYGD